MLTKRILIGLGVFALLPAFSVFTSWIDRPSTLAVYAGFIGVLLELVFLAYVLGKLARFVFEHHREEL